MSKKELVNKFRVNYGKNERVSLVCKDPSRTKQSFIDECDVNKIVERHVKNGTFQQLIAQNSGVYGDFSNPSSYQEALNTVLVAETQFASLPSSVRNRFSNDPAKFLAFATDPQNMSEMVKMGLAQVDAQKASDEALKANIAALAAALKKDTLIPEQGVPAAGAKKGSN